MSPKLETVTGSNPFPGRPMIYHPLIQNLELEKTYGHHALVNLGETSGLFEKEPLKGKGSPSKALISLGGFADRNLGPPDRTVKISKKRTLKEWYGWRWKQTLPRDCCGEEEWREIERLEKRHERRRAVGTKITGLWTQIKSRKLAISTLLALGFGIAAAKHFRPAEMWKVLLAEGPGAALYWLADPRTNQEKFAKAWNLYLRGDLAEAAAENEPLLKLKVESKTKGDAFYLAGILAARKFLPETMDYFSQALDIYEERKAFNSLYNVHLTIANYYLVQEDISLARSYLKKADQIPATRPNLGYYFEVLSDYYFKSGQYFDALASAQYSLDFYHGQNIHAVAKMQIAVGFYRALTGDYVGGLESSLEAELTMRRLGENVLFFFNKVNFYLLSKCGGQNSTPYVKLISEKITKLNDEVLKEKLRFAQEFPCPEVTGDDTGLLPPDQAEDHSPPPPPPD